MSERDDQRPTGQPGAAPRDVPAPGTGPGGAGPPDGTAGPAGRGGEAVIAVTEPWLHLPATTLGEGVVWDGRTGELLMVDIPAGLIWRIDGRTRQATHTSVPRPVGAAHPTTDPDVLVVADSDGIVLTDGTGITRLAAPLAGRPDLRMNDANVDPAGRYFAGSMAFDERPGAGTLYRLNRDGSLDPVVTGATISNGIDWSGDATRCYYVDSPLRRIDVFDYDPPTGALTNRRPFADTGTFPGIPDGLTVDAADGVWVAFFGGGRVCRYTPDGRPDVVVTLPVSQVTSCCFGGAALDELFISTATAGLAEAAVADQPLAGALFAVRPGHRGRPGHLFTGLPA